MNFYKLCLSIAILSASFCSQQAAAFEVACRSLQGDVFVVDIPEGAPFETVIDEITNKLYANDADCLLASNFQSPEYLLDFMVVAADVPAYATKAIKRNYQQALSASEAKSIEHIVLTLGNSSLISLAKSKSDLRKTGEHIDHIHPLRFLEHVFSSEKLKAAFSNMEKRKWVWSEFFDGMKRRLDEEMNNKNLLEHLDPFASKLHIDAKAIYPLAKDRRWKEFLNALFMQMPRSGNPERYGM